MLFSVRVCVAKLALIMLPNANEWFMVSARLCMLCALSAGKPEKAKKSSGRTGSDDAVRVVLFMVSVLPAGQATAKFITTLAYIAGLVYGLGRLSIATSEVIFSA